MFHLLFGLAVLGPLIFMWSFWRADRSGVEWIHTEARDVYVEAAKTLIPASSIAIAIVVSPLGVKLAFPHWIVQRAVTALTLCMVSSVLAILAIARGYALASSRTTAAQTGRLTAFELFLVLAAEYFALVGFLTGFLYMARMAYYM
jgi:hypothetical protein